MKPMVPALVALAVSSPVPAAQDLRWGCEASRTHTGCTYPQPAGGDHTGWQVAVGEVDGTAGADLLTSGGLGEPGHVRLYLGGSTTGIGCPGPEIAPSVVFTGLDVIGATPWPDTLEAWGPAVAFLGDVNGNGKGDFAIGEPYWNDGRGRVYVIFGEDLSFAACVCNPGCEIDLATPPASVRVLQGTRPDQRFGWSITSAKLDGDSRPDLVVGEPGPNEDSNTARSKGAVRIFTDDQIIAGPSPIANSSAAQTLNGDAIGDGFGHAVVNLGDIDPTPDGYEEFGASAIQAKRKDHPFDNWVPIIDPGGGVKRGFVRVYDGASKAVRYQVNGAAPTNGALDTFGFSLAVTPSVGADTVPELIVGAIGFAAETTDPLYVAESPLETGAVYILSGADGSFVGEPIFPRVPGTTNPDPAYAYHQHPSVGIKLSALFGFSVAGGTFDSDPGGDVWIGVPRYNLYVPTPPSYCPLTFPGACYADPQGGWDMLGQVLVYDGDFLSTATVVLADYRAEFKVNGDKPRMGFSLATGNIDGVGGIDAASGAIGYGVIPGGNEDGRVYVFFHL